LRLDSPEGLPIHGARPDWTSPRRRHFPQLYVLFNLWLVFWALRFFIARKMIRHLWENYFHFGPRRRKVYDALQGGSL
jgi:hypothetical protein